MTEETKKQILLHLPYLFFVYLFDKIAQGFRLSYGIDMGIKLLHFPEGLTKTFSSPLISFQPCSQNQTDMSLFYSHPFRIFSPGAHLAVHNLLRSEERRVGKECRSRWSPYH